MPIHDIRTMADEVAELMVSRFGGLRRGQRADLTTMMRRRGGALPRKLRREAYLLAEADQHLDAPKRARRVDVVRLERAHRALISHLRPLGAASRWTGSATNIAAAVCLGLLVIGGIAVWIMLRRNLI